tara:strand:- start:297 stop:509 length:213 start_codon:yes stop_codon:yes gene_type:complete
MESKIDPTDCMPEIPGTPQKPAGFSTESAQSVNRNFVLQALAVRNLPRRHHHERSTAVQTSCHSPRMFFL